MSCDVVEILKEVGMRSVAYALFCFVVQHVSMVLSPLLIPGFSKVKEDKQKSRNWDNRSVSFTHATIMFVRSFYFWVNMENWQLSVTSQSILSRGVSPYETLTVDIMIGYLIYDTIYEMRNSKGVALMLAHHVVGFFSHVISRAYCSGPAIYYTMMIYLAELSTPFLNVSWLLSELNNAPLLLTITGALLVLTFFISRVVMGPYLLYHMATHWIPGDHDAVLYYTNLLIVVFFLLMNFYWFFQLVKRVFGGPSEKKEKKVKKQT